MYKDRRYWEAYAALHDKQINLPIGRQGVVKEKSATVKYDVPKEDYEHIVAVAWLKKHGILVFHPANGGFRRYEEAQKLKRMGVEPGVPDLVIPIARKGYHGLYIEVKRQRGGVLSDAQKWWGEKLTEEGYLWVVAKGAEEVKRIVRDYLEKHLL